MKFIEKILNSDQVQWKSLWQVTVWDKRFSAVSREKQPEVKQYPYLLASELFKLEQDTGNVFLLSTGERTGWTTEALAGSNLRDGEVITIPWGKSRPLRDVIKYYKGPFVTADNRIATSNDTNNLLNKFLYYWLTTTSDLIDTFYRGSGIQHPDMAAVLDMKIPIPSLDVQLKIVKILDAFSDHTTKLKAELNSELIKRTKQYSYYRDQLFTFDNGQPEWKSLGTIGEFVRGKRFVKNDMISEGFPCIHYGEMYTHYNIWAETTKSFIDKSLALRLRVANPGDVIIVAAGETIEDIGIGTAWLGNTDVVIHDACFSYKSTLNPKYVSYFLRTKIFHKQIKKYISSGKISAINSKGLGNAKIPILPVEEQARIVAILDELDLLSKSIVEKLSLEIELRQKQYEHYRDLLLNFSKPEIM